MPFFQRPSFDELAIIAVAIIAFIVWKAAIDDDGAAAAPAPTPAPAATPAPAVPPPPPPAPAATATAAPPPAPAVTDTDQCDFGEVAANVRAAIVEVVAEDLRAGGTAFHIGDGVYVTAAHVIQDDDGRTASSIVLYANGARLPVTVDKVGSYSKIVGIVERDLAILNAPAIAAELKHRPPSEDDEVSSIDVRAFGYPWSGIEDNRSPGGSLQTSRGIVSAVTAAEGSGIEIVQTDAGVDRGMSGGPLVDECGYALAVASFYEIRETDGGNDPSEFPVFISIAELENLE